MKHLSMLILVATTTSAAAETKADALFRKAKQLSADKKYAEACPTFERVDKIEPAIGAKLNVAKCYEDWGKLAAAYQWYADAEKMARTTNDKRAPKIKELVETIDTDVPRLTITLPAGVEPGVAMVVVDNKPFPAAELGKEQRVDPGPHLIEYFASNKKPKKRNLTIEKGASTEIELDMTPPIEQPVVGPAPGSSRNWRRISGIVSGSAGIVGLGVAGALTLSARSSYKDALADNCMGVTNMCDERGVKITGNAKSRANIATVVSIISTAAVAAGVVLYLTAPKSKTSSEHALYIAPAVDEHGAAVILGGQFR
jgi:hypothetical protein